MVDGQSLYELTRASDLDLFGLLGWCSEQVEQESVRQLLLEEPTTLPGNRQSIFVCAECGDIGCGAITARIEQRGGMFIWTEFAYENDYDPEMTDRESYQRLGPFRFDADSYRTALAAAPTTPRT